MIYGTLFVLMIFILSLSVTGAKAKASTIPNGFVINYLNSVTDPSKGFALENDASKAIGEAANKIKSELDRIITQSTESGVERRIRQLQERWDGKYFTVNGKACNHNTYGTCANCRLSKMLKKLGLPTKGISDGNTCCAFQRYVYYEIFGEHDRNWTNSITKNPVIGDIIECRKKIRMEKNM